MYSLILMTAMGTAAPETASFGLLRPVACYGCVGCWGCGGGCWGRAWAGCCGCCGGCWGWRGPVHSCLGCAGCYGGGYITAMSRDIWGANYRYSASTPSSRPSYIPTSVTPQEGLPKPKTTNTSAQILLELPENAKLFVDDQLMNAGSGERRFYTPALSANEKYFYDVRVELVKDGKTISESKRVIVRAGDSIRESFKGLSAPTAVAASDKK